MTDWWQVGALATNAAVGGFVAWQAWETRKTARAGRDGVAASREGVHASREGLEIARKSVAVSQALAIDSTKARLDARAPRLLVRPAPTENEVVFGASDFGKDQPWPLDHALRRTEDDYKVLVVGAQIEITNEGDRSVEVWVDGETKFLRPSPEVLRIEGGRTFIPLGPGEQCEFRLQEGRTLKQWAEVWEARQENGDPSPAIFRGFAICRDPYDEGVSDRWEIEIYGYPVEPIPNDLAGWTIRRGHLDPPVVKAFVWPQQREYYLSKRDNRRLEPEN